jgi:hypothetical protein
VSQHNQLEVVTHARILGLTILAAIWSGINIFLTLSRRRTSGSTSNRNVQRFQLQITFIAPVLGKFWNIAVKCTIIWVTMLSFKRHWTGAKTCYVYHIYPNLSYDDSLALSGISKLSSRREEAGIKLFNEIVNIPDQSWRISCPLNRKQSMTWGNLVFLRTILWTKIDF